MTASALFQAWRESPEGAAALQAFYDAFDAADDAARDAADATDAAYASARAAYASARDKWMAEHEADTVKGESNDD